MADAGGEALNLATLWLPIVPEVSQIEGKAREAGEKFRREFHEGFRGAGSGTDMGGQLGSEVSKGFEQKTAGMFDGMMQSIATKSVAMGNLLAKGVEEGLHVLAEAAEKTFELFVEGAKKAADEVLKIGEAFEAIDRQLDIFSGSPAFSDLITGANGFNSALGRTAEDAKEAHEKLLQLAAVDVFRHLDTDAGNLGETIGILNARFGQFVDKIHQGQTATTMHAGALKELAYDLTEVGDRMGGIDVRAFSSAMQQFSIDGLHAAGVLRVMTHDAKDAGVSIQELTSNLVESGPILSELGVDADSASSGLAKIAAMGDSATQTTRGILNAAQEAGKSQSDLKQNLIDTATAMEHYQAVINDPNASQAQKDQARQNAEQLALAEGGKKNWAEMMQVLPHIIDMLNGVDSASQRAAVSAAAIAAGLPDPYSQGTLQKWLDATQDLHNKWLALTDDMKSSLAGVGVGVVQFIGSGLDSIKKWFDSNHSAIVKKIEEWGDKAIDYVLPKIKGFASALVSLMEVGASAVAAVTTVVMNLGAAVLALTGHWQDAKAMFNASSDLGKAFSRDGAAKIFQPLHDAINNLSVPPEVQQRLKDQLHDALNPRLPAGSAPAPAPGQPAPAPAPGAPAPAAPAPPAAPIGPPILVGPAGPDQRQYAPAPAQAGTSGYSYTSPSPSAQPATLAGFSLPAPLTVGLQQANQPGAHPLAANPIVRMAASALGGLTGMDANSVLKMVGLGQPAQPGRGGTTTSETAPPLNSGTAVADSFSSSPSDVMGPTAPSAAQIGTGHGPGYAGVRSTDAYGRPTDGSGTGATLAASYSSGGQPVLASSTSTVPSGPGPARPPAGWQADAYDYIQSRGKALGLSPTEINATEAVAKHESNWQSTGFMGFGPEAKAAGFNLDGNPHGAIDQFLEQYTSRRQQGGALDPNDPSSVASYIHHTVHHAADPNYTQELLTTMGGSGPARPSPAQTASYSQPVGLGAFPANPGATDTATSGSPRYGGIPGAPAGTGQNIIGYMEAQVAGYNAATGSNLSITATYPGGPFGGHSDDGGDHSARRAVDISGGAQQMTAFANYWDSHPELVAATRQLIHEGPGFSDASNIFGGQFRSGQGIYGSGTMAEHANHVHLAMQSIPGMVGAPGVAGSNNIVLTDATQPAPGGTGAAPGSPQQIQSDIDRREAARKLSDATDAVADAKDNVKKTQKTVDDTQKANDDLHNQLNSMDPKDPRRKDVQDQAEKSKATDDDLAAAKRLHEKAIRDEGSAEDALTIQKEKAELPPKAEKGEGKGGTEGAADELGKGFLGGIASDLGMGNILGGKSPDKWAAVQIAGGLFGIIMKHLFPNGFGGGIPGIGGGPDVPAAVPGAAPDGSTGSFPTGTLPDGTGPAPGPGSSGAGTGGSIPPLPLGAAHMPGQGDGSIPGLGPDGKPQGSQPGSDPIPGAPPAPAVPGAGQPPAPAPPASAAARGGGQLPIPSIPHPGADYKNWYPLSDDPYAGSNPFGVNMPNRYDPSNQNNLGPKMMTPSDQLNAYPQGTGPGHVEPPIKFAPGGSSTDDLNRFAATHPGAVSPPRGPNDKIPFTNNPGLPFGGLGDVNDLPGPNRPHAVNQSFTAPANAGQSPNVVPGSGVNLAGAFTTVAPQPLQPVGSGNQQAASVTHHYDNSIGSITAHDPQAAVAAVQEVHNSRFYTITGGMPRPSVGV